MSVLVLAGTAEARALCAACADLDLVASLAGVTRAPKDLGVATRVGGFGGDAGFARYLTEARIRAVLDATHPFAGVGHRSARIAQGLGLPYLRLLRAPWTSVPGDIWQPVPSLEAARAIIAQLPPTETVFLATGAGSALLFAGLEAPTLWLRRADPSPSPAPWRHGGFLIGLPSDDPQKELELFEKYKVSHLVAKNSGGPQGQAKLIAARRLGLPVLMVARPAPLPNRGPNRGPNQVPQTDSLQQAIAWVRAHG